MASPHLPVTFRNGSLLLPLKEREKTNSSAELEIGNVLWRRQSRQQARIILRRQHLLADGDDAGPDGQGGGGP